MVAPRRFAPLLLLAALLLGCQPLIPTVPPTPRPTSTQASAQPTSTATLAAAIAEPSLFTDDRGRLWVAGGLSNDSDQAVSQLELRIELLDSAGQTTSSLMTTPSPPQLAAGGQAHFASPLSGQSQPSSARAQLLAYQLAEEAPAEVSIRLEAILPLPAGGSRVIGYLSHEGARPLDLAGFSIAAVESGAIIALAGTTTLPGRLPAGVEIPWQAEFTRPLSAGQLEVLAAGAAPTDLTECPLAISLEPGLQQDPQGNPFFSGRLHNQSTSACSVRLLLLFRVNRKVTQLLSLASPIPLAAGEQRPFGLRLEPASAAAAEGNWSVEPFLETRRAAAARVLPLDLQLTGFENLSSNLFLRGQVVNSHEATVHQAALFAALRATDGQLLTATWLELPPEIEAGASHEFVLSLPISEEMAIGTAEFDLRALGLEAAPVSER
jgi:hypothetical protein